MYGVACGADATVSKKADHVRFCFGQIVCRLLNVGLQLLKVLPSHVEAIPKRDRRLDGFAEALSMWPECEECEEAVF